MLATAYAKQNEATALKRVLPTPSASGLGLAPQRLPVRSQNSSARSGSLAPVCSQNSSASSSSVAPCISTVKTAHAREPDHLGSARRLSFGRSACRCVGNRGMDALGVVVLDVLKEQPSQVVFAQHHDVIE